MLTYFNSNQGKIEIDIDDKNLSKAAVSKYVIYTTNTDSYSPVGHIKDLIDLANVNGYDFFIFTDKKIKNINECNQILFNYISPNPRYAAKIFKIRPDIFFKNGEISLWIDANVSFNKNLFNKINSFKESDAEIFLFNHDKRMNIFQEAEECKKNLKDSEMIIDNQINKYLNNEINIEKLGLFQGRILLRKHTTKIKDFSKFWLSEILNNSIRDQISLPYAIRHVNPSYISENSFEMKKYFSVLLHNKYNTYIKIDSFDKLFLSIKYKIIFMLAKLREFLR